MKNLKLNKFKLEQSKYEKARKKYICAMVKRDEALAALKPLAALDEDIQHTLWQHGIGLPQED